MALRAKPPHRLALYEAILSKGQVKRKMSNIFVVSRKQLALFGLLLLIVVFAAVCLRWNQSRAALAAPKEMKVFQLVTGEFKTKTDDGKELEVYRWDPAPSSSTREMPSSCALRA